MSDPKGLSIVTAVYSEQIHRWPESGRHILAQYDEDTILVYQAYRPSIGLFAAKHGYFGGDFKYTRMSWIKPSFLWMMYRSDWGRSVAKRSKLMANVRLLKSSTSATLLLISEAIFQNGKTATC